MEGWLIFLLIFQHIIFTFHECGYLSFLPQCMDIIMNTFPFTSKKITFLGIFRFLGNYSSRLVV